MSKDAGHHTHAWVSLYSGGYRCVVCDGHRDGLVERGWAA